VNNRQKLLLQLKTPRQLYDTINFGYIFNKRRIHAQNFFRDFKNHYESQVFTELSANQNEKEIVDYLDSGNFKKLQRNFTGMQKLTLDYMTFYINLDAPGQFRVIDGNKNKNRSDSPINKKTKH